MGKHRRWFEEDGTVNWPEHDEDEAKSHLKEIPPINKVSTRDRIAESSTSPIDTW